MKKLLLPLILVAPLAAQSFEVGLNVSRQQYPSITEIGLMKVEPQDKTVVAGRFGYALVDLGPALFQVTAVYQPKVDTDVQVNGVTSSTQLGQEYWGVGAMFNFKALVAVGAGVEYRSEKLSTPGLSTTYGRPWARVNAGYAFPSPLVKPFIGIEVAAPLTKKDYNDSLGSEDILKSLAPKLQVGVYGGIRF
ncbi:hypothetical protein GETHPA_27460 [Geothrix rubra]|uniref:Outer membrane protein beta-barrel domain-containing protein n=1 Tax=Geothrix rubra TaxID=2927977 RepID=A0ABQ5Q963_9BACT|nr:hypothetical protein [Geothrix rubra]GLH71213.1 hypothetical protein GETHPA_27460 [Geothrix rubra]